MFDDANRFHALNAIGDIANLKNWLAVEIPRFKADFAVALIGENLKKSGSVSGIEFHSVLAFGMG